LKKRLVAPAQQLDVYENEHEHEITAGNCSTPV